MSESWHSSSHASAMRNTMKCLKSMHNLGQMHGHLAHIVLNLWQSRSDGGLPAMDDTVLASQDKLKLRIEANRVFNPSAPVDEKALFAGRVPQIQQLIDAISQR